MEPALVNPNGVKGRIYTKYTHKEVEGPQKSASRGWPTLQTPLIFPPFIKLFIGRHIRNLLKNQLHIFKESINLHAIIRKNIVYTFSSDPEGE
jgi:hypothetical protein